MARRPISTLMSLLRKSAGRSGEDDPSDAALLERFVRNHDEAAFEILVQRFGPMVLGVCRRVLGGAHAAEDAFQATFLVLAKKAGGLARQELVGNWLWGAAYRTATRAKRDAARRLGRERQVGMRMAPDLVEEVMWRDARSVLDEEINRLPAKYRRPVVLCYLEGKTNEQAARKLGWPLGTVFTRLARARELLRTRLAKRGLTLSATAFAVALAREASAGVPAALVGSTVKAASLFAAGNTAAAAAVSARAAALAQGALKAMFVSKLRLVMAVAIVVLTFASAGTLYGYRALVGAKPDPDREDHKLAALAKEHDAKPSTGAADRPQTDPEASEKAPSGKEENSAAVDDGFGAGFGQGTGFGQGFGVGSGGGNTKLSTLSQKDVQKELALSEDQLKKIRELQNKQQKTVKAMVPQNPLDAFKDPAAAMKEMQAAAEKMKELAKEIDKSVDELLTEKQGNRLREITLQQQGGHALQDPKVADALDLSREQKKQIQEIEAAGAKKMQELGLETFGNVFKGGPAAFQKESEKVTKQMQRIWDDTGEELLGVLTTEQKSKWKEMTGKPFKEKKP
jgi:RNA polymerase sigma factor (sigma-70 family)